MSEVVDLNAPFFGEINVPDMLKNIAKEDNLKHAFVIGWGDDGVTYFSSTGDYAEIIYRLQEYMHDHFNDY